MNEPKAIVLSKDQKFQIMDNLVTHGTARILGVVTLNITKKNKKRMVRLDGNNAGFKSTGEIVEQEYIRANVTEQFKDAVNIAKKIL